MENSRYWIGNLIQLIQFKVCLAWTAVNENRFKMYDFEILQIYILFTGILQKLSGIKIHVVCFPCSITSDVEYVVQKPWSWKGL